MYLQEFPSEFQQALPILQQIEAHGYEAYFVGGSVRDFLLGKAIADVDIATSAFPAEIKQIFPKTIDTGIKHGTVTVLVDGIGYEVTTFRTESGYQDFRRPDHVTFVRSLQQDLQRRDFTINALAVRADGLIIDDYHGLNDLAAQEIRAVGIADERFHEDALRMMRAVRFASQLGFTITADTYTSLLHNAPLLQKIAVERIHTEFVKMMLGKDWRIGWQLFVDSGLIKQTPFFKANELKFPRFTTSKSTLKLLDEPAIWVLLAEGLNLTSTQLKQLLLGWKSANDVIAESLRTLTFSRQLQVTTALTAKQLYQADTQIIERAATIWPLLQWSADFDQIALDYQQLPIKNRHELQLNGVDLIQKVKLNPGPQIGDWLDRAETAVVEGRIENQNATLIQWVQQQSR
ncbi:polynucleotide adenyltransferase [Lapidilactobacillus concavus DSM 17758]|uniref:CCA-adding enzyme n=1 Tax=Lapidilactobacillus concavus DSM 17758 TaxID=1423735 RepID=A0A0R1W7A1_9LACO|nr:CCA tRNA nucleotidyltransferase [Lapidilactobacillus concavus]KRM13792.1 polynucleotide adenyltransferase [Lapidilactobacillus concavus DSM 17758]GEL12675.1 CCA-adding enzyme [Lapidilactobacillus concavus]